MAEARALLRLTAERRNGTRWSVALALGLRLNEALGLRRSYVDVDRAVLHVHWQIQRERYRHGCKDPHACGKRLHFYPCPTDCPKAQAHLRPQTSLLETLPTGLHRARREVPAVLPTQLQMPRQGVPAADKRLEVHTAEGQTEAQRTHPGPAHPAATQALRGPGRREGAGR